jgi:hypothetical protein
MKPLYQLVPLMQIWIMMAILILLTNNCNEIASLYRNNLKADSTGYINIQLKGEAPIHLVLVRGLRIITSSGQQMQEMMPSRGFQSSVDFKLHFGINKKDSVDSVIVYWPNFKTSHITSPGKNKLITIDIKQAESVRWVICRLRITDGAYLFLVDSLPFKHSENSYQRLYTAGIIAAVVQQTRSCNGKGDLNGDKLEDIFIGGAKGQAGTILFSKRMEDLQEEMMRQLTADKAFEDITAAIFDADGDGDNDLFVGSGGYELQPNDPLLQKPVVY